MFYVGCSCAAIAGAGMPAIGFLFGDVLDSFGSTSTEGDTGVRNVCILMVALGVIVWIFSTLYWTLLLLFAERATSHIRSAYLKALFNQDCAWFDSINYTELNSRLSKETQAIQKSIGEKVGTFVMSLAMTISGIALGCIKGWALALSLLAILPPLALFTVIMVHTTSSSLKESNKAYA
jgi:ATP-binding cassette subfamily B (MDR/TAP) protein 1